MYKIKFIKYNNKLQGLVGGVSELEYKTMAENFLLENEKIQKEIDYINKEIYDENEKIKILEEEIKNDNLLISQTNIYTKRCDELKIFMQKKHQELHDVRNKYKIILEIIEKKENTKQVGGVGKNEAEFLKLLGNNTQLLIKKKNANSHLNIVLDTKMKKEIELEEIKKNTVDVKLKSKLCDLYKKKIEELDDKINTYNIKIRGTNKYFRSIYKTK